MDEDTGEVVSIERNEVPLNAKLFWKIIIWEQIVESGVKSIIPYKEDMNTNDYARSFTIHFKKIISTRERGRRTYLPSVEKCKLNHRMKERRGIIDKLFFSDKRYDLEMLDVTVSTKTRS